MRREEQSASAVADRATRASTEPASGLGHAAGIPSAVLDAVADAIERARCPGREGPFGGYDYGYNTDFYGPEPEGGRYVVRDFRSPRLSTWGEWVHQTNDPDEHEQALLRFTGRHIAEAAINAYAQAIEARRAETETDSVHESAVHEGDAP